MNEWMNEWLIGWMNRHRFASQTDWLTDRPTGRTCLYICTRYVLQSVGLSIYQLVKQTVDDQPCARGRSVLFLFISKNNSNDQKLRPDMTWHDMTWHETWHDMRWNLTSCLMRFSRCLTWAWRPDLTWHDMTWHDMTRHMIPDVLSDEILEVFGQSDSFSDVGLETFDSKTSNDEPQL